ncbi:MAG: pseudouridine synthase [Candidatus Vidania fulgoroideorum]
MLKKISKIIKKQLFLYKNKKVKKNKKKYIDIYKYKDFYIIKKKVMILTYDTIKRRRNILSSIYINYKNRKIKKYKFGIMSRLDFDVSGIFIISKKVIFYKTISFLYKNRKIKKYYLLIINNNIKKNKKIKKIINNKYNYSIIKKIFYFKNINKCLIICKILTGRKNQIKNNLKKLNIKIENKSINLYKLKFLFKNNLFTNYSIINKKIFKIIKKNYKIII